MAKVVLLLLLLDGEAGRFVARVVVAKRRC